MHRPRKNKGRTIGFAWKSKASVLISRGILIERQFISLRLQDTTSRIDVVRKGERLREKASVKEIMGEVPEEF